MLWILSTLPARYGFNGIHESKSFFVKVSMIFITKDSFIQIKQSAVGVQHDKALYFVLLFILLLPNLREITSPYPQNIICKYLCSCTVYALHKQYVHVSFCVHAFINVREAVLMTVKLSPGSCLSFVLSSCQCSCDPPCFFDHWTNTFSTHCLSASLFSPSCGVRHDFSAH